MTKEEEFKIFNDYAEAEKKYWAEVERKQKRILKAVESVKGKEFLGDVMECIEYSEGAEKMWLTDKPSGSIQNEEYSNGTIKQIWVNQYVNGGYTGDEFEGDIYIKLKENKYLAFKYRM